MTDEPEPDSVSIRWNIFARELALILARRNLRLGHLDNRKDEHGPLVHPEKVRRLQRSLFTPKNLATLSPQELQRIVKAFDLNAEEEARLRAALLATAVEMLLMDRVDTHTALLAADETFHTLLDALRQEPPLPGMSGVRDPAPERPYEVFPAAYPAPLEHAVGAIERATLALHLSEDQVPTSERIDRAAEAQMGYTRALDILDRATDTDGEAWAFWREEAARGKAYAAQRLLALLAISKNNG